MDSDQPPRPLVFISWSGEFSEGVASCWQDLIDKVFLSNTCEVFFSPNVPAGSRWNQILAGNLENSDLGIVCVTSDSWKSPWLNFEAGALCKRSKHSRLWVFLAGMRRGTLECLSPRSPLLDFQYRCFRKHDKGESKAQVDAENRQGVRENVEQINGLLPRSDQHPHQTLAGVFSAHYGHFRNRMKGLLGEHDQGIGDDGQEAEGNGEELNET